MDMRISPRHNCRTENVRDGKSGEKSRIQVRCSPTDNHAMLLSLLGHLSCTVQALLDAGIDVGLAETLACADKHSHLLHLMLTRHRKAFQIRH